MVKGRRRGLSTCRSTRGSRGGHTTDYRGEGHFRAIDAIVFIAVMIVDE